MILVEEIYRVFADEDESLPTARLEELVRRAGENGGGVINYISPVDSAGEDLRPWGLELRFYTDTED